MSLVVMSTKDRGLLLPLGTITVYVVGVFINKVADTILKVLARFLRLTKIDKKEDDLGTLLGVSYHEALQRIVRESQSAYDYLSYRRSVIRIFRSLFVLSMFSPTLCVILTLVRLAQGITPSWITVVLFIVLCLVLEEFARRQYIKLQLGYYSAIQNFFQAGQLQ